MRTPRQHKIDLAVLRVLSWIPRYLQPQSVLVGDAQREAGEPRPSAAEVEVSIAYHDKEGRIFGLPGPTEMKYQITDTGRAYLAQNGG